MPSRFILSIDTEEEWDWHSGWPTHGYGARNIRMLPRLQEQCDRLGVAVTYFTNHAVLHDADARAIVLELARHERVEIGMHIHPWNTPPLNADAPVSARASFLHNLPADLVRAKLATLYELFAAHGLRPTSFRGGRYSSGPVVQRFLREHGFLADASIVPYTTWADDGAPDYRRRGLTPVRLPGATPLWEIPLTRCFSRRPFPLWQRFYQLVENTPLRTLHLIGIAERIGLVRKLWLNFEQHSADELKAFVRLLRPLELPYLCFTLHSSSLLAGGSPYTRTSDDQDRLFRHLESVLGDVVAAGLEPATVSDVARLLEADRG